MNEATQAGRDRNRVNQPHQVLKCVLGRLLSASIARPI